MPNNNLPNISPDIITAYQAEIAKTSSEATAKRKTISLNRFFNWAHKAGRIPKNPISLAEPDHAPQNKSKKVGTRAFAVMGMTVGLAILIFLLLFKLRQPIEFKINQAQEANIQTAPIVNQPITANSATIQPWKIFAKLTFKDAEPKKITFKLYPSETSSEALYTSPVQTLTPDADGNTLITLEDVPQELFFDNQKLFLEVDETRIPISTANTPIVDLHGNIVLTDKSPSIKATQGNFLLEGQAITMKTADGSDGNIEINPDGKGIAHFLFEGNKGNFLNAQGPNLTSGSLYYGMVPNNATGYDLIRLQSGAPKMTTKFSVDAVGNTYVGKNLNVAGDAVVGEQLTVNGITNTGSYTQTSGNFTINQNSGDTASIIKHATALSDVLDLTLNEDMITGSHYNTLTLNRLGGDDNSRALLVDSGNSQFDGQVQIGRFDTNPTSIGKGSLIYNSTDNNVYFWDGSTWQQVSTGASSFSGSFTDLTSGTNTSAAMVVGTGASLSTSGTGTISATDLTCSGCVSNSELANSSITINSSGILSGGGSVSLGGTLNLTATEADTLNSVTTRGATTTNAVSVGNLTSTGTTTFNGNTYTWPGSQTANGFLQTNGSGTLSWTTSVAASSVPFSGITSGTNTTAAMVVGTGASLDYTGTGTINASSLEGKTWEAPGTIGSTTPNSGAFTTISAIGDITLTQATPSILFVDNTAASDDFSINTDASTFTIVNTTDARTDLSIDGTGNTTFGGNVSGANLFQNGNAVCDASGANCASASSVAFSGITSGTNTTAAMVVGTGASLDYTGSGTINASTLEGKTWEAPGTIGSTTPNTAAFTTLTSSGNTTLGTGASSVNTIGSTTTPGTLTLHGATTLDNTFTVSGANLTSLGGNLTVTGTVWTATPTISGLITATSGLTANGDINITQTTPSMLFVDNTAASDDYSINVDANVFNITNNTDGRTELSFAGDGGITLGSATATTINLTTDGTGTGEVVLPDGSVDSTEILDNTITTSDLAATLTFSDGDLLDLSAINQSSTTEGLKLPQNTTACSSGTAEGQICWDSSTDILYVGNGTTASPIGGASSFTSFTAAGDSGGGQAITNGNTLSILGGTNGIDTIDSAVDTITLNLDTTEIGTTTFGSGSGITWTFDASGGTDTTIAFGNDTQTFTTGTATFSGDVAVNGNTTLGDAVTDNITFTGRVAQDNDLIPITTTGTNDLGSALLPWDNVYGVSFTQNGNTVCDTSGNCGTSSVGANSLDFTEFKNAMTVDAATTIAANIDGIALDLNVSPTGTFTTPVGFEITPTFGVNAVDQALTALNINPNTNSNTDSGDSLVGINLANITGTAASETAIAVGTGWDNILSYNGTPIINGSGQIVSTQINGTLFTAAGDSGSTTIIQGDTLTIAGGTNGIDTTEAADTVTLNLDTTEIGTTTFGSGSGIVWTFDASGGTDTTITFGNDTQTFTTGTATFSGDIAINGGDITTALTVDAGITATKTLSVNSGSTQNVSNITFTSPVDTSGTNVSQALNITPTIANATGGTNTANLINIGAVTGDADVTLNAIKIGALTGTAASEIALNIGSGWDSVLSVNGTTVINGTGQIVSSQINGTLFTAAGDSGSSTIIQGDTLTIAGGTNGIDTTEAADTVTLNLDTTEVGTTTWGSGSSFTWTFNASAGIDPTILFDDNKFELTGNLYLDSNSIYNSTGTLAVLLSATPSTTAHTLSGNWLVDNSSNTVASFTVTNNTATTIGNGSGNTLGVIDLQSTSLNTGNLINVEANALTTGTELNLSHTTSVIASGGSLARIASTSIDTGTTKGVLLDLSSTASLAGTQVLQTYSGLTTGIGESIVTSALTTGSALSITGPSSTGVISGATSGFVKLTSDVGSGGTEGSLLYLAPDFSAGSATTAEGIRNAATDATTIANIDYGYYGTLALTGNAAKSVFGLADRVTTSSTTGDTIRGFYENSAATGAISSGNRNMYGFLAQNASTGASSSGVNNLYGVYSIPSTSNAAGSTENVYGGYFRADGTVASGTVNSYGVYVANPTMSTTGTNTTKYGLYVEDVTASAADFNYAAVFAGGNVGIGTVTPATTLDVNGALTLEPNGSLSSIIQTNASEGRMDFVADRTTSTTIAFNFRDAAGNSSMAILDNGSVGIGDSSPSEAGVGGLVVGNAGAGNIYANFATTDSYTKALCFDGTGASQIEDCVGSVTADYMEFYPTNDDIETGDLVSPGQMYTTTKTGQRIAKLTKTNNSYQSDIIGIISDPEGAGDFNSIGYNINDSDHPMPLALNGRVPVKISPNSEAINIGDPITSSDNPGRGQKATQAGRIIGTALENWTPNNPTDKILVFVNNSYYDPDLTMTSTGDLNIAQDTNGNYKVTNTANNTVIDRIISAANLVAANIKAGAATVEQLAVKQLTVQTISPVPGENLAVKLSNGSRLTVHDSQDNEVASIDNQGNAEFNNVQANEIHSQNIDQIQEMLTQVQADQSVLLAATSSANPSELVLSDLYVTNHAAINSLLVDQTLTVNDINSLSAPLKIQSLASAPIELMAGLVTIDTHGNVSIAGNLNVAGTITSPKVEVADLVTQNLTIAASSEATESGTIINGEITTNATAGSATISAGISEIVINNPKITDYTLVYITPTSSTQNNVLYVKSKTAGQFVVGFTNPIDTDVKFNWWVVQVSQ